MGAEIHRTTPAGEGLEQRTRPEQGRVRVVAQVRLFSLALTFPGDPEREQRVEEHNHGTADRVHGGGILGEQFVHDRLAGWCGSQRCTIPGSVKLAEITPTAGEITGETWERSPGRAGMRPHLQEQSARSAATWPGRWSVCQNEISGPKTASERANNGQSITGTEQAGGSAFHAGWECGKRAREAGPADRDGRLDPPASRLECNGTKARDRITRSAPQPRVSLTRGEERTGPRIWRT